MSDDTKMLLPGNTQKAAKIKKTRMQIALVQQTKRALCLKLMKQINEAVRNKEIEIIALRM
jgi:2-phospho-L-lactate guanylyltransferase (CobY/MobA/RfbA family)